MSELAWLVGQSFHSLIRREFDWLLVLDEDAELAIACLWRLVENGRIQRTSMEDGHAFGLPTPVDAAAEVNQCLAQSSVEAFDLRDGTLDLELRFRTGHSFQIIPDSAGYEAWTLTDGRGRLIVAGGDGLSVFGPGSDEA